MAKSERGTTGIELEDAVSELGVLISNATEFQASNLEADWATAERYYNGDCDLEEFDGRSNVVKTEVRDAIRNVMPSVMRVLMQSRKPVQYIPSNPLHGRWVEQQSEYVTSLFYKNDGYMQLYYAILEAFKLKKGILKAFWEPDPNPEYFYYTKVPFSTVEEMLADPLIQLTDFTEAETELGDVDLYDVKGYKTHENGRIVMEAVPNYEFFISENCNSIEQALRMGVHGQRYIVTVAEAMDLGLDYDGNWLTLGSEDPEQTDHVSSSTQRRGHTKRAMNAVASVDVLKHEFLLTEAYVSYDIEGMGRPQIYRFYLGGVNHTYLHHEQVEDSPFSLVLPIPIPHSASGHSLADLTITEQDTHTSLLRAMIDNAHAANDAKIAADPTKTNFEDIMNTAINAPIRKRAGDTLQVIQIPFTGQGNLQTLQYLDQDIQNKLGITKAAQGLDPDALQSTDKDAVLNTIATAQGQTELMVRNIVETGLIRLFRILLRLSIQHMSPQQIMVTKGKVIPVNTNMFDPDAAAIPNVGLGTANPQQKVQALGFVLQRQEQYIEKFGPNNPFTSYAQIYNTMEDILEAQGVYNVERYFNIVTPEVEKQWAREQQKKQQAMLQQQQANQPVDPSKALMQIEQEKRQVDKIKLLGEQRYKERDLSLKALTSAEDFDIKRDELAQSRVIDLLKIKEDADKRQADEKIKREQASSKPKVKHAQSDGEGQGSGASSGQRGPSSSPDDASGEPSTGDNGQ